MAQNTPPSPMTFTAFNIIPDFNDPPRLRVDTDKGEIILLIDWPVLERFVHSTHGVLRRRGFETPGATISER